jgi:hypothetical protein
MEDAADWIDRTVTVPTLSALTLDQWVQEHLRLKKLNAEIMRSPKASAGTTRKKARLPRTFS